MIKAKGYTIKEKNGVKFIQFNHINKCNKFIHGFSTRIGGVSPYPYNNMNLGFTTKDTEKNVNNNQKLFLKALGIEDLPFRQLINLVHGNKVISYAQLPHKNIPQVDGIITNKKNIPLITTFADCIPILLADPKTNAIGVIHAGWRGTFARIVQKAIKKMCNDFSGEPQNILVGIGPGIGRCCFEVDKNVNDLFFTEFSSWKDLTSNSSNIYKWKIDLFKLNERLLTESGVLKENIVSVDLCTYCREDLFFSYRRDGKNSGRLAALIARVH